MGGCYAKMLPIKCIKTSETLWLMAFNMYDTHIYLCVPLKVIFKIGRAKYFYCLYSYERQQSGADWMETWVDTLETREDKTCTHWCMFGIYVWCYVRVVWDKIIIIYKMVTQHRESLKIDKADALICRHIIFKNVYSINKPIFTNESLYIIHSWE